LQHSSHDEEGLVLVAIEVHTRAARIRRIRRAAERFRTIESGFDYFCVVGEKNKVLSDFAFQLIEHEDRSTAAGRMPHFMPRQVKSRA
jgi:hypothetical protein